MLNSNGFLFLSLISRNIKLPFLDGHEGKRKLAELEKACQVMTVHKNLLISTGLKRFVRSTQVIIALHDSLLLSTDSKSVVFCLKQIDPRHRYGHNLQFYYERWLDAKCRQPFFYWQVSRILIARLSTLDMIMNLKLNLCMHAWFGTAG